MKLAGRVKLTKSEVALLSSLGLDSRVDRDGEVHAVEDLLLGVIRKLGELQAQNARLFEKLRRVQEAAV